MGFGSIASFYLNKAGITVPAYLGAMFAAIFIRNIGDLSGIYKIDSDTVDMISDTALAIFISMAIVSLKIVKILSLAGPLVIMLVAHLIGVLLMAYIMVFLLFGRDYEAAVMGAGFIGFMMGATSNALVSMQAVTSKYGHASKAYFVVPIVGAFFIDITNAVITVYMGGPGSPVLKWFGM